MEVTARPFEVKFADCHGGSLTVTGHGEVIAVNGETKEFAFVGPDGRVAVTNAADQTTYELDDDLQLQEHFDGKESQKAHNRLKELGIAFGRP